MVHIVNGSAIGMGAHAARLIVPASLIDPSSTVAHTDGGSGNRLIDLTGKTTTVPGTGTAAAAITAEDTPIGSTVPTPAGWSSFRYAANLKAICGATQITDPSKFHGSVQINHGHLTCAPPKSVIGGSAVWTFKHPTTGQAVTPPQAISDTLVCRTHINAAGPTFLIGNQTLVFVPGQGGIVTISNMPDGTGAGSCPPGQLVCATHFLSYYDLVDASIKPVVEGTAPPPPPGIDPNYCPPGSI